MTHRSKLDVWLLATILFGIAVLLAGANRWIAGSVLMELLICATPESYVTAPDGLVTVRAGVLRTRIPYGAITYVGPGERDGVCIQYRIGSRFLIAPEDPERFFTDMARRAPHLMRRGRGLVASWG
jgi:hypothetical protein